MTTGPYNRDLLTFKCDSVANTIARLDAGLSRLGITLEYHPGIFSENPGLFSGHLTAPKLNFFTNGKGTTPELARASAMAEMAERISARLYFLGLGETPPKGIDPAAFMRFKDCAYLKGHISAREEDLPEKVGISSLLARYRLSADRLDAIRSGPLARTWVDGYALSDHRTVKVPIAFVTEISGSNGLASGNSVEEAIVQGCCEAFERHVLIKVVRERTILPTIDPASIADARIAPLISFFEQNNISITVKDCSLGGLFPCVGVIFRNMNVEDSPNPLKAALGCYEFRMGSSFNTIEAIIRCFTEYAQGKSRSEFPSASQYDLMWDKWYVPMCRTYLPNGSFAFLVRECKYDGDLSFLEDGPVIQVSDVLRLSGDCLDDIKSIGAICRQIGTEAFVVDQTHRLIGFPAVRVIIPGVSDILRYYPDQEGDMPKIAARFPFGKFSRDSSWTRVLEEVAALAKEVEDFTFCYPFASSTFTAGPLHREINLHELLLSLYLITGNMPSLSIVAGMLAEAYPDLRAFYLDISRLAKRGRRAEIINLLRTYPGCYSFMLTAPPKNPFTHWCQAPCGNACEASYLQELDRLMKTFLD